METLQIYSTSITIGLVIGFIIGLVIGVRVILVNFENKERE